MFKCCSKVRILSMIIVLSFLGYLYLILGTHNMHLFFQFGKDKKAHNRPSQTDEKDQHYDILINTYMRSGSTYTGNTLMSVQGMFYVYEPLHPNHTWRYHDKDKLCSYTRPECESGKDFEYKESIKYLYDIYQCRIREHLNRTSKFVLEASGWHKYKNCSREDRNLRCLTSVDKMCRNAEHRMTKVLRMTVASLEPLLRTHRKLKIAHLLRDPRGIMSSHLFSNFYPVTLENLMDVKLDIRTLCRRMLNDIRSGKEMMLKYPGRFRFIQYEDIAYNESRFNAIYEYFGINATKIQKKVPKDAINATYIADKVFSYRKKLPFNVTKIINNNCLTVYQELGLRNFETKEDYEKVSINPIIKLPYPV